MKFENTDVWGFECCLFVIEAIQSFTGYMFKDRQTAYKALQVFKEKEELK